MNKKCKLYSTQSNKIKNLSKREYEILRELCLYSRNLYNVGLYSVRQYYFDNKKFLNYESNYHECKSNENYKFLQAGVSQQILKIVDRAFKSFFALKEKAKKGEYQLQKIKIPKYLDKGELYPLILSTNAINVKDGFLTIPFSREFTKKYPDTKILIPFPERLKDKNIKEVRILPVYNGQFFKIQYIYEEPEQDLNLNKSNSIAIDVGLDNLAACVSSINGTSFIIDGKKIKSINHYYNKKKAKLQSVADKQGQKHTKRLNKLTLKRNNKTNDCIKKACREIINYCIDNDIGTVVIGYNHDFKRNINIGKRNNQQFTQISFGALREQIRVLCERYSMNYAEQEESYTSKASFLDKDEIPVFKSGSDEKHTFSGRRIKRGLYKSKDGILINADINGALNILRKSKQNFNFERLCTGLLASPKRIRVC